MLRMSTARSTTQTNAGSRCGSEHMGQGTVSVSDPQFVHVLIFSRACTSDCASWRDSFGSVCTRCSAMRSAERGPMPGKRLSAASKVRTDSGSWNATLGLDHARQRESRGYLAHLLRGYFLGLRQRLVCGGDNQIFQKLRVRRRNRGGVNLD